MNINSPGIVDLSNRTIFGRPYRQWHENLVLRQWLESPFGLLEWIESKKKGNYEVIAKVCNSREDCICQFLKERAYVTFLCASVFLIAEEENVVYGVPEWVTTFSREVDKRTREANPDYADPNHQLMVETKVALDVVNAIVIELNRQVNEFTLEQIAELGAAHRKGEMPRIF